MVTTAYCCDYEYYDTILINVLVMGRGLGSYKLCSQCGLPDHDIVL
jgi:hypothetical protein